MIFIFDASQSEFIGTEPRWHTLINDNYLRYNKKIHATTFFYDWYCVEQKGQKIVIVN